jgi:hypothetical protein
MSLTNVAGKIVKITVQAAGVAISAGTDFISNQMAEKESVGKKKKAGISASTKESIAKLKKSAKELSVEIDKL